MIINFLKHIIDKIPLWIKLPLVFVVMPIAGVVLFLWVTVFLPYQKNLIRAQIIPYEERRDMQINAILQNQTLINRQIDHKLESIDRQQRLILKHLLKGSKND